MTASAQPAITEFAVIDEFLAAMRDKGIEIDEAIIADGHLHRYHVIGDRHRAQNAWAKLVIDEHPAGMFGCNKRFGKEKFKWSMKGARGLTEDERRDLKANAKERAKQRRAELDMLHAQAKDFALELYLAAEPAIEHPYLTAKGVPGSPALRVGNYFRIDEHGERKLVSSNALLVPLMTRDRTIHSIQAIFPDWNDPTTFHKLYLKNGVKEGKFFGIGKPVDDTLLICEGLSTGLSIWQCTGHGVVVAFDAGNLMSVAKEIRVARPSWRILICADNDQWTTKPVSNPGVRAARLAARAISGLVAMPEFLDTSTKPTDFNDLHQLEGEEIVRTIIARELKPKPAETESQTMERPPPPSGLPPATPPKDGDDDRRKNTYFQILGYNFDRYYIYQFSKKQVLEYSVGALNDGGFVQLADPNWWEEHFPSPNGGIDKKRAMHWVMSTADARGIFDVNKNRGRGAWLDDGRRVFHHGQYLTVDGVKTDCTRIQSRFIYQMGAALETPTDVAMTDAEGWKLLDLATKFRWAKPGSAPLLIGWIILAPLCGALKWRPHIWLTGNAGSGKSTIVESFVHGLLHGMDLYAQGNSTEPGLRQMLKADAIPVIVDETEQNEERDVTRIQSILGLMRQASTESQARTFKGTTFGDAQYFHIRSMFCLSSIQVGVKHQADTERISMLVLKPAIKDSGAAKQWDLLREQLHLMIGRDATINRRLFRRSIDMLPTILENIEVFTSAAAHIFKSQRTGDQYGTLLAGAYGLIKTTVATREDAEFFINSYDWSEHVDDSEEDESQRALQGLLEAHIRAPKGVDLTVYEVLSVAQMIPAIGVDMEVDMAVALLNRYGMRIMGNKLLLSNSSNELRALLAETTFKADWRGVLLRLPGADRNENKSVRMNGVLVKVTRIDLSSIFDEKDKYTPYTPASDPQIPF